MLIDKVENSTIITQEKLSIVALVNKLNVIYSEIANDNLIINLASLVKLTHKDFIEFLQVSNTHRKAKHSFVIVSSTIDIDETQLGFGVKAYVGINRDPKLKTDIHANLLKIAEIDRIIEVTGRFDLMVATLAEDLEQLHSIVVEKIGKIDGIQNTETFVELERTEKSPSYLSS